MKIKKILAWLDKNILTLLTAVLIVLIPLYPKIPLAELIEGYIVRLRLEDVLVFVTFVIYFVQLIRGKVKLPKNKVAKYIYAYLIIGFLSTLSAIFLIHTVPMVKAHIFKIFFHLARRIEYFSLFFITYSAVRNRKDLQLFVKTGLFALIGVILYGIGQKYFYLPAFSTMNREFSKGVLLYLQPNTRLFSTFGGHYDLAAYLMMLLGFSIPASWLVKNKKLKALLYLTSALGYWCLVLTTSRTSFVGYLAGLTFVSFLLIKYRSFWWATKRWFVVMLASLVIMFTFSDLLERFTQVLPNKETRETILAIQKIVNQPFVNEPENSHSVSELPSLLAFLFKNEKPVVIPPEEIPEDQLAIVASKSDAPPKTTKPTPVPSPDNLPSDVTEESENIRRQVASESGKTYTGPQYSENALKYGLSMGIRFDALWPQAIKGFMRNPLLGSGYSTLVKSNVGEFTYAESTDNDYLRMLGETGLLGTFTFLGAIYFVFVSAKRSFGNNDTLADIISLGVMSSIVALAINSLYIDIFESSKIAYTFWMMSALSLRNLELSTKKAKK